MLRQRLINQYQSNRKGGWQARFKRISSWPARLFSLIGIRREVEIPLFWDEKIVVVSGETVSRGLAGFGYTELALSALLIELLEPGDFFVDVGAHFGYVSLLGARLTEAPGRVLALEPNPHSFSIAQKNLDRCKWAEVRQLAASDTKGSIYIEHRPVHESAFNAVVSEPSESDYATVAVDARPLDVLLENRSHPLRVLKCDAEGGEPQVLSGAKNVISEDRPFLIMEVGMRSEEICEKISLFEGPLDLNSYEIYDFFFDGAVVLSELNRKSLTKTSGHANVLLVPKEKSNQVSSIQTTK